MGKREGGCLGTHTHLGGTRSYRSNKRKAIEDELCTSGESEDNQFKVYKWVRGMK
jgi:hypothetical protein